MTDDYIKVNDINDITETIKKFYDVACTYSFVTNPYIFALEQTLKVVMITSGEYRGYEWVVYKAEIDAMPTADVRDDATAHKVVGGGERDGSTCWFECDNCGLTVDIDDVFCKHCGARFEE